MESWVKEFNKAVSDTTIDKSASQDIIKATRATINAFNRVSTQLSKDTSIAALKTDFETHILNANIVFISMSYWMKVCGDISPDKFQEEEKKFVYFLMPRIAMLIENLEKTKQQDVKRLFVTFLNNIIEKVDDISGNIIDAPKIMYFCKEILEYIKRKKNIQSKLIFSFLSYLLAEVEGKWARSSKDDTELEKIDSHLNNFYKELNNLHASFKMRKTKVEYSLKTYGKKIEDFLTEVSEETNIALVFVDFEEFFGKIFQKMDLKKGKRFNLTELNDLEDFINVAFNSTPSQRSKIVDITTSTHIKKFIIASAKKLPPVNSSDILIFFLLLLSVCYARGVLFLDD